MTTLQSSYRPAGEGHPVAQRDYESASFEKHVQLTRTPGKVRELTGYGNANAGGHFLQIHDTKDFPADGAVPKWSRALSPTWNFDYSREAGELEFENGIFIVVSSTQDTKTYSANDAVRFNIKYTK